MPWLGDMVEILMLHDDVDEYCDPTFCGFLIWCLLGFQFGVDWDLNLTDTEVEDEGCLGLLRFYFAGLSFHKSRL